MLNDGVGSFVGAPGGRALPVLLAVAGSFLVRMLRTDRERDSAARGELRSHDCFARRARFDEIV